MCGNTPTLFGVTEIINELRSGEGVEVSRGTVLFSILSEVAYETDGKETTKRIALGTGPILLADLRSRIAVAFRLPLESPMIINILDGEDSWSFFYLGSIHCLYSPHY
jgi:hypothetical protein